MPVSQNQELTNLRRHLAIRTYDEVAKITGLSHARIYQLERQAFAKLANDPELKAMWEDEKDQIAKGDDNEH